MEKSDLHSLCTLAEYSGSIEFFSILSLFPSLVGLSWEWNRPRRCLTSDPGWSLGDTGVLPNCQPQEAADGAREAEYGTAEGVRGLGVWGSPVC